MKLIDKLKDRHNILSIILIIILVVISFRLATLTIVQGDYYRQESDTKRLKQLSITAQRGEIRDRYGRLLAGNRPSFTIQIMKDELNIRDLEKRNSVILKLVRLLEEEGVNYIDEYPISLNHFEYQDESSYMEDEISPQEHVIDIISKNNLNGKVLI